MKNISLFALQCILLSAFFFDFNDVFVSCDGTAALAGGALSEIMRNMLAQAPVKILSLVQLGLLARLLRQRRNRVAAPGADGIDNDRDGLVDEEDEWTSDTNKKNVMIFMGKHNIQVSNHGIKKGEEEGEGEESNEEVEDGGVDSEDENEESDEEDQYSDNNYKDKNKKGKTGESGYGGEEDEDKHKTNKNSKSHKNTQKKKNHKPSYGDEEEDEYDGDEPNYKPTFISYANSNNKPTETLVPWLKSLVQTHNAAANAEKGHKDSNIMALPNGFPIGGSKLEHFNKRSDDNLEDLMEFQYSESEISELLSNPQVIELLYKLNASLANDSNSADLKRSKRQLKHNNHQNLMEESRQSKQSKHSSNQSFSSLRAKNLSTSAPNYFKNSITYSSFNPITGPKLSSNWPSNDLKSQSGVKSVKHFQPMGSTKSYKLGDYMTFNPLAPKLKTSSSMNERSYGEMETTDDDEYEGPSIEGPSNGGSHYGQKGSEYGNEGSEYGDEGSKYGSDIPSGMYGGAGGMHGDINTMAFGGYDGLSQEISPNLPVIDLSYWTKVIEKTQKKKNKKKKYATTEAPVTQDTDEGDQDYNDEEEEEEEEEPSRKSHATIQIIKSGSKTGNIGINSGEDEDRSTRGWVRGLPGFRKLFGRR